jgi:phosphatidylglycerophosphatase A
LKELVINMMEERGVPVAEIGQIVLDLQKPYNPKLTLSECCDSVYMVLEKREVQHSIITGIIIDTYAEHGLFPEPLQSILREDNALYGVDEILALGITNVYGTIGLTNFGYLDKTKPGILRTLNNHTEKVHTFLDDIVAALAAAASARLAHNHERDAEETS